MGKTWLAPFAFLYGAAVSVRNKMFDWGWLPSKSYDIPIVCVGNITVGGTGKTPVTEMLVEYLSQKYNVAVLSRGYKRKTKGYREAAVNSSILEVGDEPKQIKLKFPDIVVAVCEKRTDGIDQIRQNHPEVNLIILDDGFQHRYVEPWVSILLIDYTRPTYKDHMLPWGNLRDNKSQIKRAKHVIITKCPQNMTAIDRRIVNKILGLYPYQSLYFTEMINMQPAAVFVEGDNKVIKKDQPVIAMSGIGNPEAFNEVIAQRFKLIDKLVYPDHHPYRRRDLDTITEALKNAPEGTVIMTTEKDAVKFANSKKVPQYIRERLFYQPIKVVFYDDTENDFFNKLNDDVTTNPKDRVLHS